jgi:hypothetical protein
MSWMSCRENAQRASDAVDGRLSLCGRAILWLHLIVCPPCRVFRQQLHQLRSLLRQAEPTSLADPKGLSPAAEQRIKEALRSDRGKTN